jgi:hypothetical protein
MTHAILDHRRRGRARPCRADRAGSRSASSAARGLIVIMTIAYAISTNRRAIDRELSRGA